MTAATTDQAIRVVLADDHTLFREGVASLLERAADVSLVGEAATGEDAVRLADELQADIVLMDLKMPGMGGIEATRAIVGRNPAVGVIMLTMFEDDESVFAALKAGARGYVVKGAGRGALLRAIRAVAQGEALLGASIAQRVLEQFAPTAPASVAPTGASGLAGAAAAFEELTPREQDVLRLITEGLRNREIAERLVVSEPTVKTHVRHVLEKLGLRNRAEAAALAARVLADR